MENNQQNLLEKKIYALVHRPLFMFTLFSSTSMTVLGGTIIATSIPAIESHFANVPHIDTLSKLILTLPALFVMLFSPVSGILLDRFGRLKFLIPSMFLWSISGMLGAVWDNIYWILFTRAIFGISTAFVMTSASALVADYYVGEDRQKALGLQGFATACGSAIFMCLGGFLAHYDWHYPFYVYGIGVFLAILVILELFEPRTRKKTQLIEDTKDRMDIIRLIPCYLFGFFIMVTYYTSPTQIPHLLTQKLSINEILVGFCISASALAYGLSSLFYPKIRAILSVKLIYIIGFACMGSGFFLIYFAYNFHLIATGLLIVGVGGGAIMVNNSSFLLSITPKQHIAKAMGILSATSFFGQFVSPILSQPIVRQYGISYVFLVSSFILFALSVIVAYKTK